MPRETNAKTGGQRRKGESVGTGQRRQGNKPSRGSGSGKRELQTLSRSPALPVSFTGRTVAIVGAGRLGTALALALQSCGYDVVALATQTAAAARTSARLFRSAVALTVDRLHELPPTDLLIITTPDDLIAATAELLSKTFLRAESTSTKPRRVALHASGALSSQALAQLHKANGYAIGSMHPLVSVSDSRVGAKALRSAFFCVEGEDRAVRVARRVVRDLGGESFSIKTEDKSLYHAAAVMTSGHAVALFDTALQLLVECGLSPNRARSVLLPLVRSTLENLASQRPATALTGAFARADVSTVKKHLEALSEIGNDGAASVYRVLALHSLQLAHEAGADPASLEVIKRLLVEFTENGSLRV